MPDNLIEVRDLKVCFDLPEGRIDAVKGVSFRVRPGSTVSLVGESGSGKSVVSQAIMGILPKSASITGGQILFSDPEKPGSSIDIAGLDRDGSHMRALRGGRISIIFQEPMTSLSPLHTVGNQICEALELHRGVQGAAAIEMAEEMLARVGFPSPQRAIRTYPFELSGGLRQRAMIAMALVCHPALLIADEPTTALDVTIQAQILKLGRDLQSELGMAILMITHDLGVVANMAEEVVVMYHGEVMEHGTLDHIFRQAEHPYLQALLRAVPRFNMEPGERLIPIREIKPRIGGHLTEPKAETPDGNALGAPILTVSDVQKSYTIKKGSLFGKREENRILAVDNVSFELRRGECLGLVGESGCGKTTLSKILMRALAPNNGSVTFHDQGNEIDVLALEGNELLDFRKRMQFIFQDPFSSLNPRMTVLDLIAEPLEIHGIGTPKERIELVQELMELVGLDTRHLKRYPHSFSGGQRQRLGIARALALRPEILICDEPVSALDVSIQAQILNLLKDLKETLGLTYIFVSHNLAVVDYIADRIMVMCRGRLVELAPRDLLFRNPVHPYTRGLLTAVPDPNLDNPLDFAHLMSEKASEPSVWPHPFGEHEGVAPVLRDLGGGHFVRALPDANLSELAA